MTKQLDLTKPVQTRKGLKVRILCTDVKGVNGETIIALVLDGSFEHEKTYHANGQYLPDRQHDLDLINVPEVPEVPVYRPWTAAEAVEHVGKQVKSKDGIILCANICMVRWGERIWLGDSTSWSVRELFGYFTFLDGSPCGQKVE